METIGHIPDAFIKVVDGLMSQWKAPQVIDKTDGKHGVAIEGASVSGGEIEISCIYCLYVAKAHKSIVWEKIKKYKKDLIFQKTQLFILLSQTLTN